MYIFKFFKLLRNQGDKIIKKAWLTRHDIANESKGQAKHVDEEVGAGEVCDEEVGRRSHPRTAVHHSDHEAVAYHADHEHQGVGNAERYGDCQGMSELIYGVSGERGVQPRAVEGVVVCRRHVGPQNPPTSETKIHLTSLAN